ncbi:hypothetical protein ACF0H5_012862 [Mactra antiquata]
MCCLISFLLSYILCLDGVHGVIQRDISFTKDTNVVNVYCMEADIMFGTTRGALHCAKLCQSHSTCVSVFYDHTNKECFGAASTIKNHGLYTCEPRTGMVYYKEGCGQFESTYTEFVNYALSISTPIMVLDPTTLDNCKQTCSSISDCRSFNFSAYMSKCRLFSETAVTNPGDFVPMSSVNHYAKNCI